MSLPGAMKTCLASILKWLCIVSISNRMPRWLSNTNDGFDPTSWKQSKSKFINSLNVASFEKNNT